MGLLGKQMRRKWMWLATAPELPENSIGYLVRFRSVVNLEAPATGPVRLSITADSRYRLLVNGALVGTGPAKPSARSWFVDTIDVAPMLRPGANVVGIEVLAYPDSSSGNASVRRSGVPGVSIEGSIPGGVDLGDPRAWRCAFAAGRSFLQGTNTLFLGIQESVLGGLEPHGWLGPTFDDSGWTKPVDTPRPWKDPAADPEPRPIPPMALEAVPMAGITRSRGADPGWDALLQKGSAAIGPYQQVDVDFDAGTLLTAFVDLEVSGGAGSVIRLTAAECYEDTPIEIPWLRRKADRTDALTGDLYGDPDFYRVAGQGLPSAPERFSPFWFRTVRYLRLTIRTVDAPLVIHGLRLTRTHYPLAVTGSFRSSSELDTRLWDTSVRTLLNCMHETFEDCPFYEQLQYAMDTRSQALFSLHLSTDDRLVRRAIADFAFSGDPHGLTESRAPSIWPQIIPGFSLFWIFMVGEHLEHVGDRDFTGQFLDRIDAVLAVFDGALAEDGFVLSPPETPAIDGHAEIWNFVDWTDAWRASRGVPNLGRRGANTILTFQYVAALSTAARTAGACGEPELSRRYQERASDVLNRLGSSTAWDPATRYYRDSDTGAPASQHAQVWAVLAGAVSGSAATDLMARAVRDPALAPCSYAMSHSLFDALRLAGVHELVDWQPWADMLSLRLTTWAEDTVSNRSDCHAWGSVPLQHFPRWVLGVRPLAPGFASVALDPSPSLLDYAEGFVPTPRGPIHVRWDQHSHGVLSVTSRIPRAIEAVLPESSTKVDRSVDGEFQIVTFQHPVGALASTPESRESVA